MVDLIHSNSMEFSRLVNDNGTRINRRLFADEAIYQAEQKAIFEQCWLFLGHESQLASTGEFFTTTMGEVPVIVARDEQKNLHAFINSCRHRGLPVCRADWGTAESFVCPYHLWRYGLNGDLVSVPLQNIMGATFDKSEHGLVRVPKIASYKGLIFGNLNPAAPSLIEYLGDSRFYMDCMLDRSAAGTEVLGRPQRWRIQANWKLPAENQAGDQYHAPRLHASIIPPDQVKYQNDGTGFNFATDNGHAGSIRLLPESSAEIERILGLETLADSHFDDRVFDYFLSVQKDVQQRLGSVRGRMRPLNHTIFPNFSLIWPMFSIRIAQPRGPGEIEFVSFCLINRDAPDYVKEAVARTHSAVLGAAGTVEIEDGEAWAQQYSGSSISYLNDYDYIYDALVGQQISHNDLPGTITASLSEHNARSFYLRWQQLMAGGNAR